MTHDELLAKIEHYNYMEAGDLIKALGAILELHKPRMVGVGAGSNGYAIYQEQCTCGNNYPCREIKAITKQLN